MARVHEMATVLDRYSTDKGVMGSFRDFTVSTLAVIQLRNRRRPQRQEDQHLAQYPECVLKVHLERCVGWANVAFAHPAGWPCCDMTTRTHV